MLTTPKSSTASTERLELSSYGVALRTKTLKLHFDPVSTAAEGVSWVAVGFVTADVLDFSTTEWHISSKIGHLRQEPASVGGTNAGGLGGTRLVQRSGNIPNLE
jgi:hypothetical protein